MRFTHQELHPSIFEALNEWQSQLGVLMTTAGEDRASQIAAHNRHQKAWWKEYGNAVMAWGIGYFSVGSGLFVIADNLNNGGFAALGLGVFIGAIIHGCVGYSKNRGQVTLDELEALLPSLNLSPLQRVYAEIFVALQGSVALEAGHRREILDQLNQLLDDGLRLAKQRKLLADQFGSQEMRDGLETEVRALELRVSSTQDSLAREAFEKSLVMARARLARYGDSAPLVERADGQLELINQTMASLREILISFAQAPKAEELDIAALRDRVGQIQSQSQAIESAFDEIRTLA